MKYWALLIDFKGFQKLMEIDPEWGLVDISIPEMPRVLWVSKDDEGVSYDGLVKIHRFRFAGHHSARVLEYQQIE